MEEWDQGSDLMKRRFDNIIKNMKKLNDMCVSVDSKHDIFLCKDQYGMQTNLRELPMDKRCLNLYLRETVSTRGVSLELRGKIKINLTGKGFMQDRKIRWHEYGKKKKGIFRLQKIKTISRCVENSNSIVKCSSTLKQYKTREQREINNMEGTL